jgi:hypothetical protein
MAQMKEIYTTSESKFRCFVMGLDSGVWSPCYGWKKNTVLQLRIRKEQVVGLNNIYLACKSWAFVRLDSGDFTLFIITLPAVLR